MTLPTHTYSDDQHTWSVPDLWRAAEKLSVEDVPLASLNVEELLESHAWTKDGDWVQILTVREILDHARRVEDADLTYPIILTPSGDIADGYHRVLKAHRLGHPTIRAVRLHAMPPPFKD